MARLLSLHRSLPILPLAPGKSIIELSQNQPGDHHVLGGLFKESHAGGMVGVIAIERCKQRAGIADESHLARIVGDRLGCKRGCSNATLATAANA